MFEKTIQKLHFLPIGNGIYLSRPLGARGGMWHSTRTGLGFECALPFILYRYSYVAGGSAAHLEVLNRSGNAVAIVIWVQIVRNAISIGIFQVVVPESSNA